MEAIKFARVDGRLIHGQVIVKWSKQVTIDTIYIIDDPTASDDFMKNIFLNLQNNYFFAVKIFSVEEALVHWRATQFADDKAMVLFQNIDHAVRSIEGGLPIKELNIGGVAKSKDNRTVTDAVALTAKEYDDLQRIASLKQVNIYFQAIPEKGRKALSEVKWK